MSKQNYVLTKMSKYVNMRPNVKRNMSMRKETCIMQKISPDQTADRTVNTSQHTDQKLKKNLGKMII